MRNKYIVTEGEPTRYKVECQKCGRVVHRRTTSPEEQIKIHEKFDCMHTRTRMSDCAKSVESIAEHLISGSHELSQFPDLFQGLPVKAKRVLENILDCVRPLQQELRMMQCKLDHLNSKKYGEIDIEKELTSRLPHSRDYAKGFRDCLDAITFRERKDD